MMRRKITTLMLVAALLLPALLVQAQKVIDGYNPFTFLNLDDESKLALSDVVESSYHYYQLSGDPNYTLPSTFVWYVENGTMGTYDEASDTWTPLVGTSPISSGESYEQQGVTLDGVPNSSGIWVKWEGSAGSTGYIAVYERSSDNCVFENQITGFKHNILVPPEVWFLVDNREECSDQIYSVTAQFSQVHDNSFPYTLTYTYPDAQGIPVQVDTTVVLTDLVDDQLTWDLPAVEDRDVTLDEQYTITLNILRDRYGSLGYIAPLGAIAGQHEALTLTIFHLPQTGGMTMDGL